MDPVTSFAWVVNLLGPPHNVYTPRVVFFQMRVPEANLSPTPSAYDVTWRTRYRHPAAASLSRCEALDVQLCPRSYVPA
jgi:hypothetical protein